ncbi:LysR family transcriptional regulator [Aureimonas fodinaquatilis]|uniref:LysR family transcriptional regulator n=1 Tax=Aureimonas fodinaquatilis TaxID=2565783 RepID=A0A5B0DWH1_9HYPH|nr:LysR family transcriptional regulator [Aureimonas fodinaquatilis]KAA0971114.1 LysR family transcriptional regulator [Aureimonas fodinaquatilis]
MDRFDAMRVFCRVAETRSFTQTSLELGLPRSTVTDAVKSLEARLGVRLLDRTTRVVTPTLDGEAYLSACHTILAHIEDAEASFTRGEVRGRLRVDVHGTLSRHFLLPQIGSFLDRHPEVALVLSEGDRLVDLVREGIDCAVRVGVPRDSDLIARRLGELAEITCAAPAYLEKCGVPSSSDALDGHQMVAFISSVTGAVIPLEFMTAKGRREIVLPARVSVTGGETLRLAALEGHGLIQLPRYHVEADLATGRLVEVLQDAPPSPSPVCAVYPRDRQLSPRVKVFLDWLANIRFGP